jgi:hypothetical protein
MDYDFLKFLGIAIILLAIALSVYFSKEQDFKQLFGETLAKYKQYIALVFGFVGAIFFMFFVAEYADYWDAKSKK